MGKKPRLSELGGEELGEVTRPPEPVLLLAFRVFRV